MTITQQDQINALKYQIHRRMPSLKMRLLQIAEELETMDFETEFPHPEDTDLLDVVMHIFCESNPYKPTNEIQQRKANYVITYLNEKTFDGWKRKSRR